MTWNSVLVGDVGGVLVGVSFGFPVGGIVPFLVPTIVALYGVFPLYSQTTSVSITASSGLIGKQFVNSKALIGTSLTSSSLECNTME